MFKQVLAGCALAAATSSALAQSYTVEPRHTHIT